MPAPRARRLLVLAAAVILGAGGLSACDTKVGRAASVDGATLSDSDLASYVQPNAKSYQDPQSGTTVVPKLFALETWLRQEIFRSAAGAAGGAVSESELSAARQAALGTTDLAKVEAQYRAQGYTTALGDLVIDQTAELVVFTQRLTHQDAADAVAALGDGSVNSAQLLAGIRQARPTVSVSTRYGTWNPADLTLKSDADAGLPGFVTAGAGGSSAGGG